MGCTHNKRCRYTNGYYCEDCKTFFDKDSSTYRSTELLSNIWMVLNNINADYYRRHNLNIGEVVALKEKIGFGKTHENYEELIADAEILMAKYKKNSKSASVTLG